MVFIGLGGLPTHQRVRPMTWSLMISEKKPTKKKVFTTKLVIYPFSKWLINMVIVSPVVVVPLPNGHENGV